MSASTPKSPSGKRKLSTALTPAETYVNGHLTRPAFISIAILTVITFIGNFTQLQLSSALPDIVGEFHVSLTTGQLLTSSVSLVMAIMVPFTDFMTRRFSTRQITIAFVSIFTLGSVISWLGGNFALVLTGRVMEAIGAGVMWPVLQIIIFDVFPASRRGTAMGTVGIAMSIAPAIGPTLGGWQVDATGWRSIFLSLALIGAVVLVWAIFSLRNFGANDKSTKVDFLSIALTIFGFGGAMMGMTNIESDGIENPNTWIPLVVGIVGIIWFVVRQLRMAKKVKDFDESDAVAAASSTGSFATRIKKPLPPLLDLNVFRTKGFTIGTITLTLALFAFSSIAVILPLYLQSDRGFSATVSGLVALPGALGMCVTQLIGGRMLDRHGARAISLIGMVILLIGTAMMSFVGSDTSIWMVTLDQMLRQLGIGFVMMPISTWALNNLVPSLVSAGTAVSNTARQLGGAIGSTVLVAVMDSAAKAHAKTLGAGKSTAVLSSIFGVRMALWVSVAIAAVMLVIVLFGVHGKGVQVEREEAQLKAMQNAADREDLAD